ncbi:hypothetical protein TraAM80_06551 [Trypanosoma rangeli]|uniref:LIM zinc-binding domain-containing protein n=1 Tax=Trypanosoma rangeli TaxID=5698 RepID=A0A3S5IQS9_TRYRA|nr:uncharacterized protein TraAM80_06551 [Trypanosoma rangeli]RNF02163.1 hypothetical protein TraAM80_06551 [Trypanosoma rangeli]|eukprot:RNF02163.1 hypothetical protein TraAM80_06551 [Trypanosoma rangeli]
MSTRPEQVEEKQPPSPQQWQKQQEGNEAAVGEASGRGTGGDVVVEENFSAPLPQEQQDVGQVEQGQPQDASQEQEEQVVHRAAAEEEEARDLPGVVEIEDNNVTEVGLTVGAQALLPAHVWSGSAKEADDDTQSAATDHQLQLNNTLPPLAPVAVAEKGEVYPLKTRGGVDQKSSVGHREGPAGRKYYSSGNSAPRGIVAGMTPGEEYMMFRARNGVSSNYKGPVFAVEDIHVMCAGCGAPVDPITRVPAGKLFFHPQCISCKLCGHVNIADAYFQATSNGAVCSECASKGLAKWVLREGAAARGIVPGAVTGSLGEAVKLYDLKHKLHPTNHSTVAGAVPPTLVVGCTTDRRSQTQKAFSLIQRQQYYTQNDNNIICLPPASPKGRSRTSSMSRRQGRREDMPKLM